MDPALRLATRAWFNYVSNKLGKSAGQLESLFTSAANDKKYNRGDRPKLWDRYRRGVVCPRIMGAGTKLSIVEKVDDAVPGASRWLTSAFWQLLSSKPMAMDDIREVYLSLAPEIRDLFVIKDHKSSEVFWRVRSHPKDLLAALLSDVCLQDVDDEQLLGIATAILALIREAEIKQDIDQHIEALHGWLEFRPLLGKVNPIKNILDEIDKLVKKRFLSARYFLDGAHHKWNISAQKKLTLGLDRAPHQLPIILG